MVIRQARSQRSNPLLRTRIALRLDFANQYLLTLQKLLVKKRPNGWINTVDFAGVWTSVCVSVIACAFDTACALRVHAFVHALIQILGYKAMSAEPGHKAPYSINLRHRMIIGMGLTYRKVAQNLNVAVGTVHNILDCFKQTGKLDPTKPDRSYTRQSRIASCWFDPRRSMPQSSLCYWHTNFSLYCMPHTLQAWLHTKKDSASSFAEIRTCQGQVYGWHAIFSN